VRRDAQLLELGGVPAAADAEDEPSAGEHVERGGLAGEEGRRVRGGQQDPGDQLDPGGPRRDRREHGERVPPVGVLLRPAVLEVARAARMVHLAHVQDVLAVHDVVEAELLEFGDETGDVPQRARVGRDEARQLDAE
jgi:hypothetical protein